MADDSLPNDKRCTGCGVFKPSTAFGKDKRKTRSGNPVEYLQPKCRQCESRRGVIRHRKAPEKQVESQRKYRGRHPEVVKETKRKTRSKHKSKTNASTRAYRRVHRDQVRVWRKASEYKRRQAGYGKDLAEVRQAIAETLELYRIGTQYWDVYESQLIDHPTIDHIVPLKSGGSSGADNLCVTSAANNSAKNDSSLLMYLLRRITASGSELSGPVVPAERTAGLDRNPRAALIVHAIQLIPAGRR